MCQDFFSGFLLLGVITELVAWLRSLFTAEALDKQTLDRQSWQIAGEHSRVFSS